MLGIHSMHELWEKALLLYDEEYMEQWDSEKQNRHCFYNPSSPGRQGWDFIMLPFFFVIAIVVPYRIGFDIEVPFGSFGFWLDALIDLYFAVDIFVNFRTAYLVRSTTKSEAPSSQLPGVIRQSLHMHCPEQVLRWFWQTCLRPKTDR